MGKKKNNAKNPMKPASKEVEKEEVTPEAEELNQKADKAEETTTDTDQGEINPEELSKEERVDFASDEAGEYFAENADNITKEDLDALQGKGSGENGSITVGDLEKLLKAKSPADTVKKNAEASIKHLKARREELEKTREEGEPQSLKDYDLNDPVDVALLAQEVIDGVISFSTPVRGALNNKPKVCARWNDLTEKAVALRKVMA